MAALLYCTVYTRMLRTTSEYRWWWCLWFYLNVICSDVLCGSTSHFLYGFTLVIFMNCDYSVSCCFLQCEPWSLTLWGEQRLRVIVKKVLRKIWTHDEGSNNVGEKCMKMSIMIYIPCQIWMIKYRWLKGVGVCVTRKRSKIHMWFWLEHVKKKGKAWKSQLLT